MEEGDEKMSEVHPSGKEWSCFPDPPSDFVWEAKSRFAQTHTRRYYLVDEVSSALEKSILQGNFPEATFWFMEYSAMGPQFVTSSWAIFFQIATGSISIANSHLVPWMWEQYRTYKAFTPLPPSTEGPTEGGVPEGGEGDNLDERTLSILLHVLKTLCESPKCRIVDSIIRCFFLPYPSGTYIRPYEPHRIRAHYLPIQLTSSENLPYDAIIPSGSYVADYKHGEEPVYSLFELQENDPPYLAKWCNALVQSVCVFRDLRVDCNASALAEGDQDVLSAVLYYAGLIYQCTEPCNMRNRKQDSVMILWEILSAQAGQAGQDGASSQLASLHSACNEFSKGNHKRERYFVVASILSVLFSSVDQEGRGASGELTKKFDGSSKLGAAEVKKLIADYDEQLLPVPDVAVDYTTKEGIKRKRTVLNYLNVVNELCCSSPSITTFPDVYGMLAIFYEEFRLREQFRDLKRKLVYQVPFFRQLYLSDGRETKAPSRGNSNNVSGLSAIYSLPSYMFRTPPSSEEAMEDGDEQGPKNSLPWRGQFIPYEPDDNFVTSNPHPFTQTLSNVSLVFSGSSSMTAISSSGVFSATYSHPKFASEEIVFIPCATAQQAYYQCLVDELKPLFGIPALGSHCFFIDHIVQKRDKKAEWSQANVEWQPGKGSSAGGGGSYIVAYPASSLGGIVASETTVTRLGFHSIETALMPEISKNLAGTLGKQVILQTTDFRQIRQQITNIALFYFCLGVPGASLHKMLLRPATVFSDDKNVENATRSLGIDLAEFSEAILEGRDEACIVALKGAAVIPFGEVTAFANCNFPTAIKGIRAAIARVLFIDEQSYMLQRFFDMFQHVDMDSLECILQRFGAPVVEWTGVIRDNMRDLRVSWCLWSQHMEAMQLKKLQKSREKTLARRQQKLSLVTDSDSNNKKDVTDETPQKKKKRSPAASARTSSDNKAPPKKNKVDAALHDDDATSPSSTLVKSDSSDAPIAIKKKKLPPPASAAPKK